MSKTAKVSFYGGTGTVTGANFLLEIGGLKVLIDCGLVQGDEASRRLNRAVFPYDTATIDYLLVTHAHMDHIGRIAKLVKDGFGGKIISTPETREIARLELDDAVKILATEAKNEGVLPLYELKDVDAAFSLWQTVGYHIKKDLNEEVSIFMKDAGHILGSAMIEITWNGEKIVFTGDLGNSPSILLKDTEPIIDAKYMIMESVYGDRNHPPKDERKRKLKSVIEETIKHKRTLIIPAFSLERTQMMIYEMNEMFESGEINTQVPVFIDSPLAARVTAVYRNYPQDFNDAVQKDIASGDDIFAFPRLKFTVRREESMAIENMPNPKIILAGSGMSVGGRVVLHEKHYISNPNAMILFVGYQVVGSLGRQLQDGAKKVTIYGVEKDVHAKIDSIGGYSSHKDSDNLLNFVGEAAERGRLKRVFAVMGEPRSALFLVQKIRDNTGVDAIHPEYGQTFELEF
jgi:metallo-beta-lactamase family protein